jgi:hypothetical protein
MMVIKPVWSRIIIFDFFIIRVCLVYSPVNLPIQNDDLTTQVILFDEEHGRRR